jgi:hypothetical protein
MEELESKIISQLTQSLEIDLPVKKSLSELKDILADRINYLINNDFEKLIRLLYRIDIPEKILKENLKNQKENAGAIIAEMIVERQLQKIKTREQFRSNNDIPDKEKW